jgi:GT2 family glycosyltransferase
MKAQVKTSIHDSGRCYLLVALQELEAPVAERPLEVAATAAGGAPVPAQVLPCAHERLEAAYAKPGETLAVVALPALSAPVTVRLGQAESCEVATVAYAPAATKVTSLGMRAAKNWVAADLREFEERQGSPVAHVTPLELLDTCLRVAVVTPAGEAPVAGVTLKPAGSEGGEGASSPAAPPASPAALAAPATPATPLVVQNAKGELVACEQVVLERYVEAGWEHRVVSVTFEAVPRDLTVLTVRGCMQVFCALSKRKLAEFAGAWSYKSLDAGRDPGYDAWQRRFCASARELARQREAVRGKMPQVVAVIYGGDVTTKRGVAAVATTKAALKAQTLPPVATVVVRALSELTPQDCATLETAHHSYLVFAGDTPTPHALFELASAAQSAAGECIYYGDQDTYAQKRYQAPVLKPPFAYEELAWGCYWESGLLLPAAAFLQALPQLRAAQKDKRSAVPAAEESYRVLAALYAAGTPFEHVPHVLLHTPEDRPALPQAAQTLAATCGYALPYEAAPVAGDATAATTPVPLAPAVALASPVPPAQQGEATPLISIIIPTCDHVDYLTALLTSLYELTTYPHYEVVLVENNSAEPATFAYYQELLRTHANLRVLQYSYAAAQATTFTSVNAGDLTSLLATLEEAQQEAAALTAAGVPFNYAAVINAGAAAAHGSYLCFLNNDTRILTPMWLEELLAPFARPQVAVTGAKLLFEDGRVQHAGMVCAPRGDFAHLYPGEAATAPGYLDALIRPTSPTMVTGACQLVRASAFHKLNGYREDLAIGFNDGDFCLRAREAGYQVVLAPAAQLMHKEFGTRRREATATQEERRWFKERALINLRHAGAFVPRDGYINPQLYPDSWFFKLQW